MNVDTESDHKVEKDLICFPKKPPKSEDGRFEYGEIHENGHLLSFLPLVDLRRELKRSQSLGDLTDRSSELELMVDSDHAHLHQDYPEATSKLLLFSRSFTPQRSLDVESGSGEGDVEWTDQGTPSEAIGGLDSPLTDLEVKGILSHLENEPASSVANVASQTEPAFQFVLDEGTDKDESNSTERSGGSATKANLRIHISNPNKLETRSSNEFESETGIPNSPTLYISGVSISRSPEPRSPKAAKELRSPTLCCTPERRDTSPVPIYARSRSSSLIVPSTAKSSAHLDPCAAYSRSAKRHRSIRECIHLSSLSLQATRSPSPYLMSELRVSRSASEPEKGRLVFQFPKSPTEGALSSVLHVEESTLSSDDFHEALFLSKSPKPSKRKKSKRERNKEKDKPTKGDEKKVKEKPKDYKEKHKETKDKRKFLDASTVV